MKKLSGLIVFILLMSLNYSKAQNNQEELCPLVKLPPSVDSLDRTKALDSVANLAIGHFKLLEFGGGWTLLKKPHKSIELVIKKYGKAILYENGKQMAECKFSLFSRYDYVRYTLNEECRTYFHLGKSSRRRFEGSFFVCEKGLIINDLLSDGLGYVFKRIK